MLKNAARNFTLALTLVVLTEPQYFSEHGFARCDSDRQDRSTAPFVELRSAAGRCSAGVVD